MTKPPERYEWSPLDDRTSRWLGAIAMLVVLHLVWMIFIAWYVQLEERGFLIGGCYAESDSADHGGWLSFSSGPCPPGRPYANVLQWVVPIIGFLVSSLLPLIVFRIPMDEFSEESERNLNSWLILCIVVPIVLGVVVIGWTVG